MEKENIKSGLLDQNDIQEAIDTLKKYAKTVRNNSERDVVSEIASEMDKSEQLKEFANEFRELNQNSSDLSVKDLARKLSDLAGKPTMEELKPAVRYLKDLSEKVAGLNLDMADKMSGYEKMEMAAKLNKLILDGTLTENDFDGIVLCGFPKASIEMWKELYKPATERKKSSKDCTFFRRIEDKLDQEAVASAEQQKEIDRQIKLGETIEFQNQIKIMTDHLKDPSFKDFYKDQDDLGQGEFFEIQRLFDWATERTPTATIEIKELAELLQACESWHTNGRVRKSTEYVEWFKQRMEWLENQIDINTRALQGMLSDNDSLLDGLKEKNKQIPKEMAEMISNDIKYSTLPDGSKIKEYYREGVLVRTENLGKMVQSYRGGMPIRAQHYEGDNYNEFMGLKPKNTSKEEPQAKTVMFEENKIPNKVKSEFDEKGLEKRSYYKDDQFVRSVDAFGDVSDKPKNPVVARNIEEIAKKQRETSPLWKSLEGVSKSPFLTGDLKEAAKTLQKYSKILEDGKPFDAKDDQSDSLKQKQDRIKKYRTKTEDEWKNSINNTERILEKKNIPKELSVYEQLVKARQDKSVSELNQSKTFGEVSGNDFEQAVKILQKYAEIVEDNISYQEDNFIATPVDVKGTDGPFRRKLPNKIESYVVEKQEKKSKLTSLIRYISQSAKSGLISNSAEEKNKKFHELSNSANSDKAEKFIDGVKSSVKQTTPEPMFDLSPWQKTKVYFRDLKNKASTLFKSPEITEEEVDRAIQLMEKQIAEIKKSKNPTPEMYAHLFDHLLPGKDSNSKKYPVVVMPDLIKKREEKAEHDKVIFDQKSKMLLSNFKNMILTLKLNEVISDGELIEIFLYTDAVELMSHFQCFCENGYPDLNRCFKTVETYHNEVVLKNSIKVKDLIDVYSDFLLEVELLLK